MRRDRFHPVVLSFLLAVGTLAGCRKPDINQMMQPVPRPPELDALEAFVGEWEGTMKMRPAGSEETMESTGHSRLTWVCDKRYLMERWSATMGDEGAYEGISLWTYDPQAGCYRIWSFDSSGGMGEGTARYDSDTGVWSMKVRGRHASGDKTLGEGTITFTGPNRMEWNFTEWDAWKWNRLMEMSGVSERK